jgi:hypothetical protein
MTATYNRVSARLNDTKEDLIITKIIGLNASRIGLNGRKYLRWPKFYSSDVVVPDEEEGGKAMWCAVLDKREDKKL